MGIPDSLDRQDKFFRENPWTLDPNDAYVPDDEERENAWQTP